MANKVKILLITIFQLLLIGKSSASILYKLPNLNSVYSDSSFADGNFLNNKSIPAKILPECQLALSNFPELKNIEIDFEYKTIKFTMQTKPKINFLFKSRSKRSYKIQINNNSKFYTGMDYNELSMEAKIGWIGHELSHIIDFQERNIFQIIGVGIKYSSTKFKKKLERKVDIITIDHGLGQELYAGVDYMMNHSAASEAYKQNFQEHYLSLKEIVKRMKERKEKRKVQKNKTEDQFYLSELK